MEQLAKQLGDLRKKIGDLSTMARLALFGGLAALIVTVIIASMLSSSATYQYAFTNLTTEDSSEASAQLKAAGIAHRVEAGGTALAVPASQVYDARLLLAAAGLPRGGGVGFEIFDKGDLGVSEFTQRINLKRATEGELMRTISRLAAVRSARVHITLPEKGLYRDEDRKATAAVVVNLQPGRALADREIQGMRHLIASAVPGLDSEAVTIVDGRGGVLAGTSSGAAKSAGDTQDLERSLEGRVVDMIEKAVGSGAVVAKVTASMDTSEVESTNDSYDPDSATVRSERKTTEAVGPDALGSAGIAGAAANQPSGGATTTGGGAVGRGSSMREDEVKNYEITKTVTHTTTRGPRLRRLSIAVLVDGKDGQPRGAAELQRLADLAKGAVGFDAARGDKFEISSAPFLISKAEDGSMPLPIWAQPVVRYGAMGAAGLIALLLVMGVVLVARKGGRRQSSRDMAMLQPGRSISDVEALMAPPAVAALGAASGAAAGGELGPDPAIVVRDRARRIAVEDPERAAMLLKAWVQSDADKETAGRA